VTCSSDGRGVHIDYAQRATGRLADLADSTTPLEPTLEAAAERVRGAPGTAAARPEAGKGILLAERDGRAMQLTAQLIEEDRKDPIRVSDSLTVEGIDPERERVIVSTH